MSRNRFAFLFDRRGWWLLVVPCGLVGCATVAHPERLLNKLKTWHVPSVQELAEGTPVTTSFDDALTEVPLLDGFEPRYFIPLTRVRGAQGARYPLSPGAYALDARSYCLKAGTYGPGEGMGYLPAPLAGRKAKLVKAILERAKDHPELGQHEIQLLLWGIIGRLEFKDMSPALQATAAALLTPQERFELNGGWLGLVPAGTWQKLEQELPTELRELYRVEERLRQELSSVERTFTQIESFAVRTGVAPLFDELRKVPKGRWSYLDGGFFVRYFPSSYSRTRVEVFVPEAVEVKRDAAGRLRSLRAEDLGLVDFAAPTDGAAPTELRFRPAASELGSEAPKAGRGSGASVQLLAAGPALWSRVDAAVDTAAIGQMLLGLNAASQEGIGRLSELARWRSALAEATDAPVPVKAAMDDLLVRAQAFEICVEAGDCTRGEPVPENPEASPGPDEVAPRDFDLPATVAVPANRSGQRLGISDQPAAELPWGCALERGESAASYCKREDVYDRWAGMFRQLSRTDASFEGPLAFYKMARDVMFAYCWAEPGGPAVERAMNELSGAVFEANLSQCNRLVEGERLLDPLTGEPSTANALDWALRYVQFEQCVVGKSLAALKKRDAKLYAEVLRSQNRAFSLASWSFLDNPRGWATGVIPENFDLGNYSHRVTVGYAGVFRKLGKTREEFRLALKASPPPKSCPGAP